MPASRYSMLLKLQVTVRQHNLVRGRLRVSQPDTYANPEGSRVRVILLRRL